MYCHHLIPSCRIYVFSFVATTWFHHAEHTVSPSCNVSPEYQSKLSTPSTEPVVLGHERFRCCRKDHKAPLHQSLTDHSGIRASECSALHHRYRGLRIRLLVWPLLDSAWHQTRIFWIMSKPLQTMNTWSAASEIWAGYKISWSDLLKRHGNIKLLDPQFHVMFL